MGGVGEQGNEADYCGKNVADQRGKSQLFAERENLIKDETL
jgi:hypothetical protein